MNGHRILRRTAAIAAATAAAGIALATTATPASAAPVPHVDVKNHAIVVDVPAGEWWECQAISNTAPFIAYSPGYLQYALGPNKIVFPQFPRGAQVWISCNGTGLPVIYYGPILTA